MKKHLLLFLLSFIFVTSASGDDVKSFSLTFEKSDFSFEKNEKEEILVVPMAQSACYNEDANAIGLPYLSFKVIVPKSYNYDGVDYSTTKNLLFNNCLIASAPRPQVTGSVDNIGCVNSDKLTTKDLKTDVVTYEGESSVADSKLLYFNVCPFMYDSQNKKLYIINKIDFSVKLKANNIPMAPSQNSTLFSEKIIDIAINPEDWLDRRVKRDFDLDYVIVTNRDLQNSFLPLIKWKRMKGVRSEIATVEDIDANYSANDLQEKIKLFLSDMHYQRGLQYAMLGGDDEIVPVRYCYSYNDGNGKHMPTDLYYACFDGQFDWDKNKNKVYGECSDSVNLFPNIFVTRVPVRTESDAEAFAEKIISYEKCEDIGKYKNEMLMCGCPLDTVRTAPTDSEKKGDRLYNDYIKDDWNGKNNKLYYSSTVYGDNYEAYKDSMQEKLSNGYMFVDVIAHGGPHGWGTKTKLVYSCDDALSLYNKGFSSIATNSCYTNAFDSEKIECYREPCLSESFIRNRNSGVVSYFGCSREGWCYYRTAAFGLSLEYETKYYKNLLSEKYVDKNFGKIAAYSKIDMLGFCNGYGLHRWLQFGLNPIGDPEMPIFTCVPKKIRNTQILIGKKEMNITAGIDSCTVCIMSQDDEGASYYNVVHGENNFTIATPNLNRLMICITRQNYAPKIIKDIQAPLQENLIYVIGGISGGIIDIDRPYPGSAKVEYSISESAKSAKAIVSTSEGTICDTYTLHTGNGSFDCNLSKFPKGIISLSLIVDGKLIDSAKINNK